MPIVPTSLTNIKVGYIDETDGYVKDVSISAANEYEKLFPGTAFIFVDGDGKIKYLSIDEVNNLTPDDLARKEPCEVGPQPCGPPILNFVGGGGIGAEANPVVDVNGNLIAVDIVSGGFGYESPPKVEVIDHCENGSGAVLQAIILDGVVVKVIVLDTGRGYLPAAGATPQYPALIKLTDVVVTNPGINYECGIDQLTVTPNNGTVLEYKCDPFGKIKSVGVIRGGNFTSLPNITLPSEQGFNARFVPVFEVIRDPLVPEVALPTDIVQVFDLVGLNINGYIGGKAYYGNVYYVDGVKYAGTSSADGTNTRVYDTKPESTKGTN